MRARQLSLRFSLITIAVAAIALTYATRQRRIASHLRAFDSSVELYYRYQYNDYEDVDHYSLDRDAQLSPALSYFGPDVASTIVKVSSRGSDDPAEIAKFSSRLPHLRQLAIQDAPLKDADLLPIATLSKIRGLYLRGTAITDDAVTILSQLSSLRVLNVTNTSLSPEAIDRLRESLPDTRVHAGPSSGGMM